MNRRQAIALIEQHVGSNYEILQENEVVTGSARELENLSNETAAKEYQIHYWKSGVFRRGADSLPRLSLPTAGLGRLDQSEDYGIIAIPDGSEKHRNEAIKLIEKHVGPDYVIVREGEAEGDGGKRSAKYYLFYRKKSAIASKPDWKPLLWMDPSGKVSTGWMSGGIL